MRIRKGDTVKILYGRDSGKTGKVLNVDYKKSLLVVEGMNQHRKHVKGDGQSKKSEVITIVKPMPVSKVMLVDMGSGDATRVRFEEKDGAKIRISVRSGKPVDEIVEAKKKPAKKKEAKKTAKKKTTKKTTANKDTKKKTTSKSKKTKK